LDGGVCVAGVAEVDQAGRGFGLGKKGRREEGSKVKEEPKVVRVSAGCRVCGKRGGGLRP
jgi:hypothetical protein